MKLRTLLLTILIMIFAVSCEIFDPIINPDKGADGESQSEYFDVTKAVKLKDGINNIGKVPEGYELLSFTLYSPDKYDGTQKSWFSLSAKDRSEVSRDLGSSSVTVTYASEVDEATLEAEKLKAMIDYDYPQVLSGEKHTTELYAYTDSVAYYVVKTDKTFRYGEKDFLKMTYSAFGKQIVDGIAAEIEALVNEESRYVTGYEHDDPKLDIDGNGRLIVFLMDVSDPSLKNADGFVNNADVILYNRDCFYFNLNSNSNYLKKDYGYTLEQALPIFKEIFIHEYMHYLLGQVNGKYYYCGSSFIEGMADLATILYRDYLEGAQIAHQLSLFMSSYQAHPVQESSSFYSYAMMSRFLYYLWANYLTDSESSLLEMSTASGILDVTKKLTGRDFEDVYREFFLSVFSSVNGTGSIDFGENITAFIENNILGMGASDILQELHMMDYYKDYYDSGFSPYRDSRNPIVVKDLPGCSFVVSLWSGDIESFTYTAGDDVETWVFAVKME